MHNSIYEISRCPVPLNQQARAGHMPDWFYERICDYAENHSPAGRESALHTLSTLLGRFCTREKDKLTISPKIKEVFFRNSFDCFKAAAQALAQTDYNVFAGLTPSPAFPLALSGLNDSYEDSQGIYIYSPETEELLTLERWLRNTDLSHPFYIGGTIDYHC